jgi:hypothetical protein
MTKGGESMYKRIICILSVIFLSFSCNGKDPICTIENESDRTALHFEQDITIFPDDEGGIYYDADITEILRGPGSTAETEWG